MSSIETITGILHNTRPLLSSDMAWISSNISSLQAQIARSKSGDSDAKANNAVDTDTLEHHLAMHESALAPVRRLPNDVLLEIFQFVVPDPEEDSACDAGNMRWVLSHVSSFWRQFTISCPSLWTVVVMRTPHHKHAASVLEQHLLLSGSLPLDVGMLISLDEGDYDSNIRRMISATSSRWRLLDVRMPKIAVETIFSYVAPGLPLLEELSLECDATPDIPSHLVDANMVEIIGYMSLHPGAGIGKRNWFDNCPRLRRACLLVCPGSGIVLDQKLTHYSGIHFQSDGLPDLLERESLVELNMVDLHPDHLGILPPTTHRNIVKLRMCATSLNNLNLPQLVELTVDDEDVKPMLQSLITPVHTDYLLAFLSRSKCQLRNLHIYDLSITTDRRLLTEVLPPQSQSVMSLGLSLHPIQAQDVLLDLFSRLTHTSSNAGLVPNMTDLDISVPDSDKVFLKDEAKTAIFDMVHSRRNRELAALWRALLLEEFRFDNDSKEYMNRLRSECLDGLEEGGLRVLKPTGEAWLLWQGPWLDRENWI